jgi:hypothetical protein
MERSEGVSVVLDHIMKMMDRSGERLLRNFNRLEGSHIRVGGSHPNLQPASASLKSRR